MDIETIAIVRADEGVSIMSFIISAGLRDYSFEAATANGFSLSEDGLEWRREPTDEAIQAEVYRAVPNAASWRRVNASEVPADRMFRNAWRDAGKTIEPDLDASKEIVRNTIRAARKDQFAPLDATVSRLQSKALLGSLDAADKAALTDAETKRQALRDAPANPTIDAATSVGELAGLLPTR